MMPAEYDITGKVVFVTGAGRGIGKGIAQVLAEAGADVALNALTPRYVEGTAAEIAKASGRRVVPVIADVTRPDGVKQAVDQVLATFGRIDVLVNALGDAVRKPLVGLPGQEGAGTTLSDGDLRFIMDINLTEALLCTRAVGPHMLERRSGKVINIAAWTAHQGGREMVLYTTAKTALAGFTRAQALDWAPFGHPGELHRTGPLSRRGDLRRGGVARSTRRAGGGSAGTARQVAGGRASGALSRLECLRLHDGPDHPARRGPRPLRFRPRGTRGGLHGTDCQELLEDAP